MRGKTAKLLRKVAQTNPYEIAKFDPDAETRYIIKSLSGNILNKNSTIFLAPGYRFTYKQLKKFYKDRKFNTEDLKKELI